MNKFFNHQFFYWIALVVIGGLLGGAEFLQTYRGVNPCPLCILQRITFVLLGILFIIGITPVSTNRAGQIILGLLCAFISILGIALSGRQVWLQLQPSTQGANCEVSLQYLLKALPFDQVLAKVFQGGSGCSQVGWEFLGFSLAQWSLVCFVLFLFFCLWQLRKNT